MSPEHIAVDTCHEYRKEIFGSLFPRWALLIAGGVLGLGLLGVYGLTTNAKSVAVEAANETKMLAKEFTLTIEHIRKSLSKIETESKEQRILLHEIDKKLDRGR